MSNKNQKELIYKLIEEETDYLLQKEGLADWVKQGVRKLSSAWELIKDKFFTAADSIRGILQRKILEVKQIYPQALEQYKELKEIEAQSGEKLPIDDIIKLANDLPEAGRLALEEIQKDQQEIVIASQHIQTQAQEAFMDHATKLLSESLEHYEIGHRRHLNERKILKEFDPFGIVGLGLGVIGGVPMLVRGLHKFAKFLKLTLTAEFLEKVYKVLHRVEEKAIDYIVPDKLSYLYYKKKYNLTRAAKQAAALSFEEYKKSQIRKRVEQQMYIILLIPFLLSGISFVSQAGFSLIGAAKGTANTVKAIEIGNEVLAIAKAIKT